MTFLPFLYHIIYYYYRYTQIVSSLHDVKMRSQHEKHETQKESSAISYQSAWDEIEFSKSTSAHTRRDDVSILSLHKTVLK